MKSHLLIAAAVSAMLFPSCSTTTPSADKSDKKSYFIDVSYTLKDGRVTDPEVLRTDAPKELQKAALESVRKKFRTKPGHSGYTSRRILITLD